MTDGFGWKASFRGRVNLNVLLMTMGAVDTVEISSSRWKTIPFFVGSVAIAAFTLFELQNPDPDPPMLKLGLAFASLCAVVFAWALVRPLRLLLDDEGFTLVGGLVRSPTKVRWHDIESFFVHRVNGRYKTIGYNYKSGVRAASLWRDLSRSLGADGVITADWPRSTDGMVEYLNACRTEAVIKETR